MPQHLYVAIISGFIGILSFCLGIYRITNGRMMALSDRLNKKIERSECREAQKNIKELLDSYDKRMEDNFKNLYIRFDDLKLFIRRGGRDE